jgi:hypothetical protein
VLRFKNVPVDWLLLDWDTNKNIITTTIAIIAIAINTTVVIGNPWDLDKGFCAPHQLCQKSLCLV